MARARRLRFMPHSGVLATLAIVRRQRFGDQTYFALSDQLGGFSPAATCGTSKPNAHETDHATVILSLETVSSKISIVATLCATGNDQEPNLLCAGLSRVGILET